MKRLLAVLALLVLFPAALSPQPVWPKYVAFHEVATGVASLTIQQPASGAKIAHLDSAYAYCEAACTVSQSINGTAATATASTPAVLTSGASAASVTAFTATDAGSGTALPAFVLAAGERLALDLTGMSMTGNSTAVNYTIKITTGTTKAKVSVAWREE